MKGEEMSEIEELERRITAAMDRIGQGLEALQSGGSADEGELDKLKQQLEDEKLANEQLKERVKTLKARTDAAQDEIDKIKADHADGLAKFDKDLQSLRTANEQLRENNKALREANEAGVAEPHLINKAMLAELEGLRAARAADRSETQAILSELSSALDAAPDAETEDA